MSDYLLKPFGKPDAGRFMRAIDGFTLDYTCSPMADILGLGLSHYPPLCLPDADMAGILRWTLQDSSIPAKKKDVANWPAPMREEWSSDQGTRAAAEHRKQLIAGFDKVRAALDAFQPDVVVISTFTPGATRRPRR
jgi:hypothetical protein